MIPWVHMKNALPEGYTFVRQEQIIADDIVSLRREVGWDPADADTWNACLTESISVVGVMERNTLVGVGFLAGNSRHAVLCDLAVHPRHRGLGLGKILLLERVEAADARGVKYLYADIAETNPMKKVYSSLGFETTGGGLFRENPYTTFLSFS